MSRYFTSSVAATALMALLAGPVLAQESAPGVIEAPKGEATEAAPVALPQALADLGLTNVTSKNMRRGTRVNGTLPDGTSINAMLDDQGELMGVRAGKDAALPANLLERLVPQAVRSQQIYGELGQIGAVFTGDRGVMLAGKDAQSNPVRAAFAEDGTLLRFGRGDDRGMGKGMGRGMGMGPDHGPKGGHGMGGRDRDHGDRMHGDRDHGGKGRKHMDKEHRGEHRGGPDRDARQGGPAPDGAAAAPLAPDAIRSSLTDAGYTEIGQILQQGPITVAQATNPEGEAVLVELGPDGRVVRELNR